MTAIVSIFCMFYGLWLCFKGVKTYFVVKDMERNGSHTVATIIDIEREESVDPETGTTYSYWPVYEYLDIYGTTHQQRPSSTTGLEDYRIGDTVDILYKPDYPNEEILVLTKAGKWKDVLGYTASGLFSILIGAGVFIQNGLHEKLLN